MAQLDSKSGLKGNIGDLVFRNVNGKTIVQSRPDTSGKARKGRGKQTATDFGRASQITSSLFRGLRPFLSTLYDSQFFNRFRKGVYQGMKMNDTLPQGSLDLWQGEPSVLEGLEADRNNEYAQYVQIPRLQMNLNERTLEIEIPEFKASTHLFWPANAAEAELCYWVCAYDAKTYQFLRHELFSIPIHHKTATLGAARFTATGLPQEALILITGGVLYYSADIRLGTLCINSKAFNPAQVMKVFKA
ncbi:hypothetical protein [Leeuwenhoekiella aestuarii]|uniref:Uncharacterized protein n=1 Tax=Leeuwenhoekiella aestuarii TaxID=2249426 RepID=A0A4V1KPJ1_9FLAO|nr:hypothetical protein [Leeuwenhoekiella aestuarii]RXG15733.1 hypothetical protein DSM04_103622 [Leeuwenhoekiella aestuarii]